MTKDKVAIIETDEGEVIPVPGGFRAARCPKPWEVPEAVRGTLPESPCISAARPKQLSGHRSLQSQPRGRRQLCDSQAGLRGSGD